MLSDDEKQLIRVIIYSAILLVCIIGTTYIFMTKPMFCVETINETNYNTNAETSKKCFYSPFERNDKLREISAGVNNGNYTD